MIKVAFIAARLQTGGAERQWYQLIEGMDRKQFGIVLICLYDLGELGKQIEGLGVKTYTGLLKNRFSFFATGKITNILKKEKIDVVFLWNQPLTMIYGIAAAKKARVDKIIAVIHSTGYLERKFRAGIINRLFMRFITKIVALGEQHKNYIVRYERVSPGKVVVIFNGVEIKEYELEINKQRKKEQLGIPPNVKVVGIVARLHKVKRHDIFLKAAKLVRMQYKNVYFIIVGEGEERSMINHLIHELDLTHNVKMLGLRKDIPEINAILDVAVISSEVEALPMSVIEAMASSVPVVSTKVGSVSDLVTDGDNGFLVAPGAVEDLAKAILKLLENDELAARMGRRGHEIACEKFSRDAMVKGYETLFKEEYKS